MPGHSPYPWWVTRKGSVCQNLMIFDEVNKQEELLAYQSRSLVFLAITSINSYQVIPAIRKNKIIKFITSLTCRINEKQVMKGNEPPKTEDPAFSIVIIINFVFFSFC